MFARVEVCHTQLIQRFAVGTVGCCKVLFKYDGCGEVALLCIERFTLYSLHLECELVIGHLFEVGGSFSLGQGVVFHLKGSGSGVVACLAAIYWRTFHAGKSFGCLLVAAGGIVGVGRVEGYLVGIVVADDIEDVELCGSLLILLFLYHCEGIG